MLELRVRAVDAGERWLRTYVATARNPKGRALAELRFRCYFCPFFERLDLGELNGDHVRSYRLFLEEYGLRPGTVTHVLSDLRCLLRWAASIGLLARSPFPPRVLPRLPELPPRGFDDRELATLMAVRGRTGFVLRLLLGTGLRWAEACRALRDHVRNGFLEVANTKSGRLRRVPLTRPLLEEIAAIGEPRLVPFAAGSPGSFSRSVRRRTGIAGFHVHRCRHTFAMRWVEAEGNLAVLQAILGHRDLTTTMRYARVTDALVWREAHDVADKLQIGVLEDFDAELGVERDF